MIRQGENKVKNSEGSWSQLRFLSQQPNVKVAKYQKITKFVKTNKSARRNGHKNN